jgi:hypothetical protein
MGTNNWYTNDGYGFGSFAGSYVNCADQHCAQNLASGALSEAHFGHGLLSDVAHWLQNRAPAALSVPHFEQRIGSP